MARSVLHVLHFVMPLLRWSVPQAWQNQAGAAALVCLGGGGDLRERTTVVCHGALHQSAPLAWPHVHRCLGAMARRGVRGRADGRGRPAGAMHDLSKAA